ncbi:zinc-finger homeodomain protein 2-like [Gastrolobium bilobum]|uniref:zinc-finger homeodomain protein 2-like n=1 Tax=Gastrolobium bilobum TaxID=150636 RepID=UPI002AB185F5|nr:zinc-finger homeodomain protein 2-like [Gastrolobium bilobum]
MEFEDHEEEQEEELCMAAASYDSLSNPSRVKMPGGAEAMMVAQPLRNNNAKARYRECLKNHAVGIGGHALDGCGEFMAAGTEGTLESLKCAACNCHRNFHRKETETATFAGDPYLLTHHHHHHQPPPPQFGAYYRTPGGYLHVAGQQRGAGTLALPSTSGAGGGGGCGTQSTREDQEDVSNPSAGGLGSKKRYRTKFSQEQKDKMLELAERLGWRIQKHDDAVIQEFCNDTGVKRHVLKVWMHNNKHTLGKKP